MSRVIREKIAESHPNGYAFMSPDVFEEIHWVVRADIMDMPPGRKKMEASLSYAFQCREMDDNDEAYCVFAALLEETVKDGIVVKKYKDIATRAYQGLISVQSCEDELSWETSSELLEKYRPLFERL